MNWADILFSHTQLWKLVIGWTSVGVFVATAIITLLALVGLIGLKEGHFSRLFTVLVIEIVVIGVAAFSNLLGVDPQPTAAQLESGAAALQVREAFATEPAMADLPAIAQGRATEARAAAAPMVFIQSPGELPATVGAISTALRDEDFRTFAVSDVDVRVPLGSPVVRYFHADDQPTAAKVREVAEAQGVQATLNLIEWSSVPAGQIELWLPAN